MPVTLLPFLFLLAMGQGLFLIVTLLAKPQPAMRCANAFLASLVGVVVVVIGHAWLGLDDGFSRFPWLARSVAPLPLLVGPLLWLYLRAVLQPDGGPAKPWLHFVPFGLAAAVWGYNLVELGTSGLNRA